MCNWGTASSGKFLTGCDKLVEWNIPDLDDYKFCPFCGKGLYVLVAR